MPNTTTLITYSQSDCSESHDIESSSGTRQYFYNSPVAWLGKATENRRSST